MGIVLVLVNAMFILSQYLQYHVIRTFLRAGK
jgi:hypothetical protein